MLAFNCPGRDIGVLACYLLNQYHQFESLTHHESLAWLQNWGPRAKLGDCVPRP